MSKTQEIRQETQESPDARAGQKTVVHPLVDILENEDEFLLVADLPGVTKDQLELEAELGKLTLEAQTETLEYRRAFNVGDEIDLDGVEASLEHGVLKIHLPKRAEARVRKIQING